MSTEDQTPPQPQIDLAAMRAATVTIAEMIYVYHQALLNSGGFTLDQAFQLTMAYQQAAMGRAFS